MSKSTEYLGGALISNLVRRRETVALLACGLALGCTEFDPGSDTLLDESDSTLLPPGPPGEDWSCLGGEPTVAPPVFARDAPRVVYSVQFVDLSSGEIYRNIEVRACPLTDVNCTSPVASGLRVDAAGWVDVPLFEGFTGYLEVTSDETIPYMFYLNEPLEPQTEQEFPLGIVSLANIGPLVGLVGGTYVPGTGVVALRIFDCQGVPASGVSLSSEPEGTAFYFAGGLPTNAAKSTGTDGLAGFVNMAEGSTVVQAFTRNGVAIKEPQSVVVRPNWMTAVYLKAATSAVSRAED
jgi:hypothetical protein